MKEALKMALEAAYLAGFNASGEGYNGEYPFGDKMQDPAENRVWKEDRDNYIKEALAQPEQDPVHTTQTSIVFYNGNSPSEKNEVLRITKEGITVNPAFKPDEAAAAVLRALDSQIKNLMTQPAQRKSWVSMTPEQHLQIIYAHRTSTDEEFMEAIDTKLRELNEAPARQQNPLGGQRNLVEILAENWRVWPARKVVEQTSLGDVYCSAKGRDLMFGNHEIASDQGSAVVTKEMWSAMREELASKAKEQPAQRKPLTDEQIEQIAAKTLFPVPFARAIEAAHGIKENTCQ